MIVNKLAIASKGYVANSLKLGIASKGYIDLDLDVSEEQNRTHDAFQQDVYYLQALREDEEILAIITGFMECH